MDPPSHVVGREPGMLGVGIGSVGAAEWLKKENHHLLEENARLRVDMDAITKAAGGEVDIDRLRRKLSAATEAAKDKETLEERVKELETQLHDYADAEQSLRQSHEAQLREARRVASEWRQRYEQLESEHSAALAQADSGLEQSSQQLNKLLEEQRERKAEDAARLAAAAEAQTRIDAAEAVAAEWERQCGELRQKYAARTKEFQSKEKEMVSQLEANFERRATRLVDTVCTHLLCPALRLLP
jgi:DNA repair exonuclease SbcCD ATPase subunit